MSTSLTLCLLFLLVGLVLGFALGYLWQRFRAGRNLLDREVVERDFVPRVAFDTLQQQNDLLQENFQEKIAAEQALIGQLATERANLAHLRERLQQHEEELLRLQEYSRLTFENIAGRLLEEKSQRFTALNQEKLEQLLQPLRERLTAFESGIERRHQEETRDRISLQKEIEHLRVLNQQLSTDANNLANALKGDNKAQGDWGELQLEVLLERAGLQRGVHFRTQHSFRDESGQLKRPDFVINLPNDKHLVIDCKVSLVAYERYCHCDTDEDRQRHLRAHLDSLRAHLRSLNGKNYQQLYEINSPDYLLLFVPIEPAYLLAVQQDQRLFQDALEQNIVIVTASTLLITMRTVSFIWTQEKQKRSVQEIARLGGLLYDKFCTFAEDLVAVGNRLDGAQQAYQDAMYKLVDGKRRSSTLVGQAERLKELGARTSRHLPRELMENDRLEETLEQ